MVVMTSEQHEANGPSSSVPLSLLAASTRSNRFPRRQLLPRDDDAHEQQPTDAAPSPSHFTFTACLLKLN